MAAEENGMTPQPSEQPRTAAGRALSQKMTGTDTWMLAAILAIEVEAAMNGWNLHVEQLGDPDRAAFMEGYQAAKDEAAEAAAPDPVASPAGPCIFTGCVSRDRHWHGGFPGGYTDPADPEGPPIPFTTEPEPGVRDYNGAVLGPVATPAPLDVERLARAIHSVGKKWYRESGEIEDRHIEGNSDQLAAAIAAEYARLEGQPVAEEPA